MATESDLLEYIERSLPQLFSKYIARRAEIVLKEFWDNLSVQSQERVLEKWAVARAETAARVADSTTTPVTIFWTCVGLLPDATNHLVFCAPGNPPADGRSHPLQNFIQALLQEVNLGAPGAHGFWRSILQFCQHSMKSNLAEDAQECLADGSVWLNLLAGQPLPEPAAHLLLRLLQIGISYGSNAPSNKRLAVLTQAAIRQQLVELKDLALLAANMRRIMENWLPEFQLHQQIIKIGRDGLSVIQLLDVLDQFEQLSKLYIGTVEERIEAVREICAKEEEEEDRRYGDKELFWALTPLRQHLTSPHCDHGSWTDQYVTFISDAVAGGLGIALAVAAFACVTVAIHGGWAAKGRSWADRAYGYVGWFIAIMAFLIGGYLYGTSLWRRLTQWGQRRAFIYDGRNQLLRMRSALPASPAGASTPTAGVGAPAAGTSQPRLTEMV